jgi:hypothetical protein
MKEVSMTRTLFVLAFTLSAMWMLSSGPSAQQPVNRQAQSMVDFRHRIDDYLELRREITRKVPEVKETGDPAKISSRERALGTAIASARKTAMPGDVFGAEMSVYLKKTLADDWRSRSAADRKAIFSELPKGIQLRINQPYPTTLPLVSVPAKLLAVLPMLPEELEYRFIDRYFLLRDRDANLVIDILPGVLPQRTTGE